MSRRAAYRRDKLLVANGPCPQPTKTGYNLRSSAEEALRRIQESGSPYRLENRIYECTCGQHHLTSKALGESEEGEVQGEALYIPTDGSLLARTVRQGSGIWASWEGRNMFLVDYEGGLYQSNIATFADRVMQARDRQLALYPTIARMSVAMESLTFIGHYLPETGEIELLDEGTTSDLCRWIELDVLDPAQLLTTNHSHQIARYERLQQAQGGQA